MNPLLTPQEITDILPLSPHGKSFLASTKYVIQKILTLNDPRKIFIVGPCSIHNIEKALEYARKLKKLSDEVKESILIIMRTHFEKPRTKMGWKGLVYDPRLDGSNDIQLGVLKARRFLIEMAQLGLPASAEILDPYIYHYYEDLLCYSMIGARTCTSQPHRQIAALTKLPVGIKNSVDGNIEAAVQAVAFAQNAHSFLALNKLGYLSPVETNGNPYSHIVLRGSKIARNYDAISLQKAVKWLEHHNVATPVMVDCSHGNKEEGCQLESFYTTLEHMQQSTFPIIGLTIESYLKGGKYQGEEIQKAPKDISITDACISFEQTEKWIRDAHKALIAKKPTVKIHSALI